MRKKKLTLFEIYCLCSLHFKLDLSLDVGLDAEANNSFAVIIKQSDAKEWADIGQRSLEGHIHNVIDNITLCDGAFSLGEMFTGVFVFLGNWMGYGDNGKLGFNINGQWVGVGIRGECHVETNWLSLVEIAWGSITVFRPNIIGQFSLWALKC